MWLLINNIHEKKFDIVKQKKRKCITQLGKNCAIDCAIQGVRLIWKQKIWLVLTKPYCSLANHNPEFRCVICTVLHFLHSCYTFCTPFSANQNWVIFSCLLLDRLRQRNVLSTTNQIIVFGRSHCRCSRRCLKQQRQRFESGVATKSDGNGFFPLEHRITDALS